MNYRIERCNGPDKGIYSHGGKWVIRTWHKSGIIYAEETCAHFRTRKEAEAFALAFGKEEE